jgi:hypothetical protein
VQWLQFGDFSPKLVEGSLAKIRQNSLGAVMAKMSEEQAQRLQKRIDEVWERMRKTTGLDYEGSIALLRRITRDPTTSPAAWMLELARSRVRKLFPDGGTDTLQPEDVYPILGLIESRENAYKSLLELPEEAVPMVDRMVDFWIKEEMPAIRSRAQAIVREYPYKRGGGPKTGSMPNFAVCREICETIERLHIKDDVPKGIVQEQMKQRFNLSLRMVQRIWHDRKKYLS